MSRVRISVEWCFGKVLSLFPVVDLKKESEDLPPTCWENLPRCCFINKHAYMRQQFGHNIFLWITSPRTRVLYDETSTELNITLVSRLNELFSELTSFRYCFPQFLLSARA
jgi:hypothetical protein